MIQVEKISRTTETIHRPNRPCDSERDCRRSIAFMPKETSKASQTSPSHPPAQICPNTLTLPCASPSHENIKLLSQLLPNAPFPVHAGSQ